MQDLHDIVKKFKKPAWNRVAGIKKWRRGWDSNPRYPVKGTLT